MLFWYGLRDSAIQKGTIMINYQIAEVKVWYNFIIVCSALYKFQSQNYHYAIIRGDLLNIYIH